MKPSTLPTLAAAIATLATAGLAFAAPATYDIDASHTFPSFEADHMGISTWRGKLNKSGGKVVLDAATGTGTVLIDMDLNSIDFGLDALDQWARGKDFFDTAQYPRATYSGKLGGFVDGKPTLVDGELRLHGVTRPVQLKILGFKCVPHPMFKREQCGADALATIQRDEFGLTAGKDYGFRMDVLLRIQVEALKTE